MGQGRRSRIGGINGASGQPGAYFKQDRAEMVQFLPPAYHRVLEVGCGEGDFAQYLSKRAELWGCEPNKMAARSGSRKFLKILVGKYEEIEQRLPDHYFDLVVCNDVIEHMQDHDLFFESISRKMSDGGYLVGSIPNVRHIRNLYGLMIKKDWEYTDSMTLDRTHLRFFTERSLVRSLGSHGFNVEALRGINGSVNMINRAILFLVSLVTLGFYRDIEYLQFGFRARKIHGVSS